tara:strand:- start:989 stop:1678 length:690 start_codon:yes stop_codon:yes gene_type:complete
MNINLVLPVNNPRILTIEDINSLGLADNITCNITLPNNHLLEITSKEDEEIARPSIVSSVIESAESGADAVIVYCFGEPGVEESRQKVNVPVLGIAAPAMHMASMLGKRFSVIASVEEHCPLINALAKKFGLIDNMAAPLAVNISPDSFNNNDDLLLSRLIGKAKLSIENEKVDTFILGCGSMQSKASLIREAIKHTLGYTVQVVDPLSISVHLAIVIVKAGLTTNLKI